jgi:hypothetical protein
MARIGSFSGVLRAFGALTLLLAGAAGARAMDFRLETLRAGCSAGCPQVIVAEGQIANSTPGEFLQFLRNNGGRRDLRTVVFLNSEGGYVIASMELGQIFRKIGAATVVAHIGPSKKAGFLTAHCLSACVYAFMGGVKRVVPPGSALGIHRMFANQAREHGLFGEGTVEKVYDNGSMQNMLANYSARMGVSRDVIHSAEHISSQTIHIVTPAELARWRLASRNF